MEARAVQPVPQSHTIGRLIAGVFFTAAGVLLSADNLGVFEAEPILRLWPVALIAIGALKILAPGSSRIAAILLILAGTWILLYNFDLVRVSVFELWPLLLIALGLGIFARGLGIGPSPANPDRPRTGSSVAVLSSRKIVENTNDFRAANAVSFLGGTQIDLTRADITNGPAVIDALAVWGGVEIVVPDHWEVIGEVTPVMGGFVVKTPTAADPTRRLIVRGLALMGGIEVKNASGRAS